MGESGEARGDQPVIALFKKKKYWVLLKSQSPYGKITQSPCKMLAFHHQGVLQPTTTRRVDWGVHWPASLSWLRFIRWPKNIWCFEKLVGVNGTTRGPWVCSRDWPLNILCSLLQKKKRLAVERDRCTAIRGCPHNTYIHTYIHTFKQSRDSLPYPSDKNCVEIEHWTL